ncbi:hypothetical protein ECDEC12C_2131 [Escherichia coli DEC12C]|nr:hypothetical protein ECDEC12C_2131 [Escherichia coli DEC12C]
MREFNHFDFELNGIIRAFLRTAVNDFMDSVHHIWCPLFSQEFQDLPDGAETTLTFDVTLLILLGLAALGFISHNTTVAVSILVLIIVRVTPLSTFFPWIEKQGLSIGIIILTIGVMAPIASGTLPPSTLIHSFLNWKSLVAIAVGVIVSWLGGRGVTLMGSQPQLVAGLLVGTVLGVALFRGVPVGPLIAAGLVSLIVGKQ